LAKGTIEGAAVQARETLDELRSLSRSIAPPILVDRGLAPALEEVAGRSPAAVTLAITVANPLSPAIESAAYFVVSEALANVAKHSRANAVEIVVDGDYDRVLVSVTDNGCGGAALAKGHGLAGLAERVRGLGGSLDLSSPDGGPTVLTVEMPCGS
jgi:signal transduction histidine kinase